MANPVHISSLLLRADPAKLSMVVDAINSFECADVAVSDPSGKIIVTLETDSESIIVEHMNSLSLIDGIVSTALVYHQKDDEI